MDAAFGIPSEAELDWVFGLVLKSNDLVKILEKYCGVSHTDSRAFKEVVKTAMMAGGITYADGRPWGGGHNAPRNVGVRPDIGNLLRSLRETAGS